MGICVSENPNTAELNYALEGPWRLFEAVSREAMDQDARNKIPRPDSGD